MNRPENAQFRTAVAATLLRFALGVTFLAHGLLKVLVFTLPGTAAYFEQQGFPGILAYPVAGGEIAGGLALLAGVLVRPASLALLPILAGVVATVAHNGWLYGAGDDGGWEFPALLIVAVLVQALLGPGLLALGPAVSRRRERSRRRVAIATA